MWDPEEGLWGTELRAGRKVCDSLQRTGRRTSKETGTHTEKENFTCGGSTALGGEPKLKESK